MWEAVPLRSVAAADAGLVGGPFGSSLVSKDYVDDGVPVIRGENLGHGRYVDGTFAYVSEDKFERDLKRNVATGGDIVFTQRGTLGQVAMVRSSSIQPFVVSQSQMRLRVDPGVASTEFIYYASPKPRNTRSAHHTSSAPR
jgi:type I restriction enzyme, S subunit